MRIGIEAWAAKDVLAGRGRYVRELLRALRALPGAPALTLLTRDPWEELELSALDRWVPLPGSGPRWVLRAAAKLPRLGLDVLLTPTSHALAALASVPSVTVLHDPFAFERQVVLPRGAGLERMTLRAASYRVRAAVAVSAATREVVTRFVPRLGGRTRVVPLAAAPVFFGAAADPMVAARHGIGGPYVLAPGTLEPRKNLPHLLEAFTRTGLEAQLVLAGPRGWQSAELDAAVTRAGGRVRVLGAISDSDLAALYAGASLVAYPSRAEGFGLPVLEAMAAGAPVLTSSCSSLPEVAGDAAVLVDPTDVHAIAAGIQRGFGDRVLAARGRERAASFSWRRTASETLDVLASVARAPYSTGRSPRRRDDGR